MVHRRSLDGETLTFGNQGHLWQNAMTWYDHDTGSIWSQPLGEAILGPRKGERLELLPSTLTTWDAWKRQHPDTVALDAPGGRSGFRFEQMVIVLAIADETMAFRFVDVQDHGPVDATVGGVPVTVAVDPSDISVWIVRSRLVGDTMVDLEWRDGAVFDPASGTSWDAGGGVGSGGNLAGEPLDPVPALTAFPRDYRSFWPDGRLWALPE